MICIKTEIPQEICDIDDEFKAIYHSIDLLILLGKSMTYKNISFLLIKIR